GTDVPLAPEWVEGARRFANKLWNATRFALGTLDGTRPGDLPPADALTLEDRWILSRLEATREAVDRAFETWDMARISERLYHFTWDELADWYLEAVKGRMYGDDEDAKVTARAVLARVLDDLLRMLHPLVPFVTETLWRALTGAAGGADSLMVQPWPGPVAERDATAEDDFAVVQDLVTEVRRFRSQNDVRPSARFPLTVACSRADVIRDHGHLVRALAGLEAVELVDEIAEQPGTSRIQFATGDAQVALAGLIDVDAELARLRKERDKADADLQRAQGKLANDAFVSRAPEHVVQG